MAHAEQQMKNLSWPAVIMILGLALMLLTSVTILAIHGDNVTVIMGAVGTLVLAMAAAFGVDLRHQIGKVQDVANGRLTAAVEDAQAARKETKELQAQLTAMALQMPSWQAPVAAQAIAAAPTTVAAEVEPQP